MEASRRQHLKILSKVIKIRSCCRKFSIPLATVSPLVYLVIVVGQMAKTSPHLRAGVISRRGSGGGAPLVKIFDHFGGLNPQKILALALLFKVY